MSVYIAGGEPDGKEKGQYVHLGGSGQIESTAVLYGCKDSEGGEVCFGWQL